MSARPIDAAEGYRLFRRVHGRVELDEINEYLRGLSLREVSARMLVHYRRLLQHGYESYIPINRFDVAVAADHAWSEDLRARYPEISQAVAGELVWEARTREVSVESLGVATASVIADEAPPAGTPVVLRLLATGIERSGTVVRVDKASGRFHVAFDPYTSVPIAPLDARFQANLRFSLAGDAVSFVALTDTVVKLQRLLMRVSASERDVVRVKRISMGSPLEVALIGGVALEVVLRLAAKLVEIRKRWHEGTVAKYQAEGLQLDNEQKRRSAQLETDRALASALEAEMSADITPLLDEIASPELPQGEPESAERRRLIDAGNAAIELPIDTEGSIDDRGEPDLAG